MAASPTDPGPDPAGYQAFLRGKIRLAPTLGLDVTAADVSERCKPFTRDVVAWAVRGGRRALFLRFGLHKTVSQLEIMRILMQRSAHEGPALIVMPQDVRHEFRSDAAEILGWDPLGRIGRLPFVRHDSEIIDDALYLTNYESLRDGKIDPARFMAVSLDEAAILRSYGSKTFQQFLPLFEAVPYRFVATALPSPNRVKELIHYAGFLGVMETGQALTRFFARDPQKAGNLTLYPHKEREFWLWAASWALFLQTPSDLGYPDEGYVLPELDVRWHEVPVDLADAGYDRDGQGKLIRDAAIGVQDAAREKRVSLPARVAKAVEIRQADPQDHFILWHDLEDERRALERALPSVRPIYGSQDPDERERVLLGFKAGEIADLAAKPVMLGAGGNLQAHCHRAVYTGIGHKFHDFLQSVHRLQRFGQAHPVRIDLIYAETEREIRRDMERKWAEDRDLRARMSALIREYGLSRLSLSAPLTRSMGVERRAEAGTGWTMALNDCVDEVAGMDHGSVDLVVTSIPFANHYEYTPSYNDFGHTDDNAHFWRQMDFLTPELFRVLAPGRLACIHVKDRILFGNVTGAGIPTVSPFHAEAIDHYRAHGFDFCGMVTVVTDVVRENNQTYRLGWTEQCKDGTKMGVGSPEYVLLLHKPQSDRSRGYADTPVAKDKAEYSRARWQVDAHALWRSSGDRLLTADELAALGPDVLAKAFPDQSLRQVYDHEAHVRIGEALDARGALPSTFMAIAPGSHHPDVWHDVIRMRTLNGEQTRRGLENHVCLARGSLVLTATGYKPIEKVAVGDQVLTHKGRWRRVQVARNTGVRPVVEMRAQGVPGLLLTPDHEVWARRVPSDAWSRAHARAAARKAAPDWLPAAALAGSYVNQKLPAAGESEMAVTDRELWLVGRWIADGHVETRGGHVVSIGAEKLERFRRMAGPHAGGEANPGTATQIRLVGLSECALALLRACGSGAAGKEVPPAVFGLPQRQARHLLDGYLAGDGHYLPHRNRWLASTVSRKLALGISMLAQQVHGAVASVYAGRGAGSTVIEGRQVRTRQDWIVCFDVPAAGRPKGLPFVEEDGAWKRVRSVARAGEAETWCLRVEEDESFTAEGCIVKNCPLQFDIVDRLIRRYSNPGELVFDPFGGLGTVPLRALHLGRRGRAVELNPHYWADACGYLRAAERELSVPGLFDALPALDPALDDAPAAAGEAAE